MASYSADGDSVEFNVSVPTNGWVAIGFSPNQAMVRCFPCSVLRIDAYVLLQKHLTNSKLMMMVCVLVATTLLAIG